MQHQYRSDSHNHSLCSPDGDDSVRDMCLRAMELGLYAYTLTDHCECNKYPDRYRSRVKNAREVMEAAAAEFSGRLRFYRGIELGQPMQDVQAAEDAVAYGYDFIIGSVHNIRGFEDFFFLDYTDVEENYIDTLLTAYFAELLETARWGKFDALGHLTYPLRYIEGEHGIPVDMTRHRESIDGLFQELIRRDIALEVNTSGYRQKIGRPLPDLPYLKRYRELGGSLVTLGSDAHCARDLGKGIDEGMELLKTAGFTEFAIYEKRSPVLLPLE